MKKKETEERQLRDQTPSPRNGARVRIYNGADEAYRLARLIALLMRVHPAKAMHADAMLQVRLTDAAGRSFALHLRWTVVNIIDKPQAYSRSADAVIATTSLTWAELCVGLISVAAAFEEGRLKVERGSFAEAQRILDSFHRLRESDLVYPPRRM